MSAGGEGIALGYEPSGGEGRIRIPLGGCHRADAASEAHRKRLISAVLEVRAEPETRLVLLGVEVDGLRPAGREALRSRIAFLPADGGLLSSLNGWENIVLPIGFHRPHGLHQVEARVHDMLTALGADPGALLEKLPERMTQYEKKLTAYVRIALEKPDLVLAEDPQGRTDSAERAAEAQISAAYLEGCPGGTFVLLGTVSGP